MAKLSVEFLIDHFNEGFFALDHDGKILHFNRYAADVLKKDPKKIIGKKFKDVFPEVEGSELHERYRSAIQHNRQESFETHFNIEPYSNWLKAHIIPFNDGASVFFTVISQLRDLENSKQKYEKQITESEERFRNLFQNSPDGIAIQQDKKVILANPAAAAFLGYENTEELEGKPISAFIHPDHLSDAFSRLEKTQKGDDSMYPIEEYLLKKDGSTMVAELSAAASTINGKPATQIYFRDITGRKAMEERLADSNRASLNLLEDLTQEIEYRKKTQQALEESEENFRSIFNNAQVGIFRTDLQTGKLLLANQRMAEMFGYDSVEDAIENFISEERYVDKEEREKINQMLTQDKSFDNHEAAFYTKSGEVRWFQYSGRLYEKKGYLEGVGIDVTERKKYEEELRQRNEFIQTILDNLPIGIAINEINSGSALYFNRKFEEIYGWPKENIKDIEGFFNCVYPDEKYRETIRQRINHDIKSGDPQRMHWENIEITTKKGEKRKVNAVNIPLYRQNVMISTVMDITALKNAENELRAALIKAEESDRLKSAFLANMSHEIRTPMNSIMGFSEILGEKDVSREKQRKFAGIIHKNSMYLLQLINDIVDLAKIESGQLTLNMNKFDLNNLLNHVTESFTSDPKLTENPHLTLQLKNDTLDRLYVTGDETRLQQILNNLINNALKFTEEGTVEFGYEKDHDNFRFFVKDTGIGIKPEHLGNVFNRFFQGDHSLSAKYGGTGLGLSICRGLVELFDGKIAVSSTPGKGSEFSFTAPKLTVVEIAEDHVSGKQKIEKGQLTDLVVLVAEDEEFNFMLISEILSKAGCRVLHAVTGTEALEKFNDIPEIGLVMMDIKLPGMNGYDVTRQMKKIRPEVPVIAQTAYAMAGDREKSLAAGCDDYLPKPIRKQQLLEKIANLIK